MDIYIEPLIIQNFALTYFAGALVYRFLRIKQDWCRLLFCSMAASAAALLYPLISLPVAASVAFKFALGAALSGILFAGKCNYLKGMLAFYVISFAFGGFVCFVGYLKFGSVADALNKPLSVGFPAVMLCGIVLYYILRRLALICHRRADLSSYMCEYNAELCGKIVSGKGFIDTGNRLYDSVTGLPVVVIGIKALMPDLTDEELSHILSGHAEKVFKGARRMKCGSVGGESSLWIVIPDKFEVYSAKSGNIVYEVAVGLSFSRFSGGEDYNAILPAFAAPQCVAQ